MCTANLACQLEDCRSEAFHEFRDEGWGFSLRDDRGALLEDLLEAAWFGGVGV